ALDGRADLVGVRDPAEREVAVVGAGRVEVDGPDAEDPVEQALVRVDVLDAVDPGLLDALGEDAAPDPQALRRHDVVRADPPQEADDEDEDDAHDEYDRADRGLARDADHDADDHGRADAVDVEAEDAPPRRVALEDDLLARVQVHRGAPLSCTGGAAAHRPGRAPDDGPRAARAVRLRAAGRGRRRLGARRAGRAARPCGARARARG